MADLRRDDGVRGGSGDPSGDTDRGQVILVAAFAIAVIFVALALVVNSAIYTENLATRSDTRAGSDALETRHGIEQTLGEAIRFANRYNNSEYGHVSDNVSVALGNAREYVGIQSADRSTAISLERVGDRPGSLVRQDNRTDFRNSTAGNRAADWTLATQVERTRAFHVNVTERTRLDGLGGTPFTVRVEESAPVSDRHWRLTVAGDAAPTDLVVEVERSDTGTTATCRVSESGPVTIDVTGGTVGGEPCPALDVVGGEEMHYGAGVARPYNVSFENGDAIAGNYSLVVTNTSIGQNPGSFASYGDPDGPTGQPFVSPAMYRLDVLFDYRTPQLSYETVVRIARGEPE